MTRIGLVGFALLLVACKPSKPIERPVPKDDPADTTACETLDEAGCRGRSDCAAIGAIPLEGDCSMPQEFVGCGAADMACGDALTYAVDPDGNAWWFMDTCLPEGWADQPYPEGMSEPPPAC